MTYTCDCQVVKSDSLFVVNFYTYFERPSVPQGWNVLSSSSSYVMSLKFIFLVLLELGHRL